MSPITIIRNPLNEKENLVFALNNKGGLKVVNTTLFISQGAHAAKPVEVEAGPAFAPSSLTSALYRNTVCNNPPAPKKVLRLDLRADTYYLPVRFASLE